ncbi:hypothetical protein [Silvimonas sp.]|uniref:hypothetical protein n=1 Tax=Silvimonas sp. TaxID=2650811 RepID=UPI002842D7A2|nr:hypothetical protein [Silvimonas sp.]MDR3426112.1 hypothetical protein [Silvimonas sp.]
MTHTHGQELPHAVTDFVWPRVPDYLGSEYAAERRRLEYPVTLWSFPENNVLNIELFSNTGDDSGYSRLEVAPVNDAQFPGYMVRMHKNSMNGLACVFIKRNIASQEQISELCFRAIDAVSPWFWGDPKRNSRTRAATAWLSGPDTHTLLAVLAQRIGGARAVLRDTCIVI